MSLQWNRHNSMAIRANQITPITVNEYYSDFTRNLDLNPISSILGRITNEDAVKSSVKNLILTRQTERVYQPSVGCRLYQFLFDPIDMGTATLIRDEIRGSIENYEPRANLLDVRVIPNYDDSAYQVYIIFSIKNIVPGNVVNLTIVLERIR